MGRRCVRPRITEGLEARPGRADPVEDPEQVEGRAADPIELAHDRGVARLQLVEHAFEFGPPDDAADLLTVDAFGTGFLSSAFWVFNVCPAVDTRA
jgi:hypothetical protein